MPPITSAAYIWIIASVLWGVVALWWVCKGLPMTAPGEPPTKRQRVFADNLTILYVLVAVVSSAWMSVHFSDDVIRYAWDGWVTVNGGDPYAYAPAAAELQHLRVTDGGLTLPDQVPFNDLRTVYPPGAQWLFASVAWMVGTDVGAWPIAWMIPLLLLFTAIYWWRDKDLQTNVWLGLLLLSPVLLVHGLSDVHLDVLVGASMLAAFYAARRGKYIWAGVLLGVGVSLKFLPLIAVVYLLVTATRRQRAQILLPLLVVVALAWAPFLGSDLLGNLPNFAANWRANAGLYEIVRLLMPTEVARWLMLALALGTSVLIWVRWRLHQATAVALTLIAVLLMSPVVHAWYLLPAALLLPIAPLRSTLVWLATMSIYGLWVAAYQTTGVWTETPALLAVEYVPVWIAFMLDVQRGPLDQRFKLKMV